MIHVALAGYGYWGPKLARNFNELSGATLAAVCDFRTDRLEHVHAQPQAYCPKYQGRQS